MAGLSVRLLDRNFGESPVSPPVIYAVQRYSWAAVGGPREAEIGVSGRAEALWELIEGLRCPIEIVDAYGEAVWWGYVQAVEITVGGWTVGVSLETMFNRVAVVYSQVAPGSNEVGTRAETAWAQHDASVATYGRRELKAALAGATAAQSEALRAALLDQHKLPLPSVRFQRAGGELAATLKCRGWWQTLDWQYLAQSAGREGYEPSLVEEQAVGQAATAERAAQSFRLSASQPWAAYSVRLPLRRNGSPADSLVVEVCADNAGAPGTVLASGSLAGSALTETAEWLDVALSAPPPALALATTYWLVVRRSGAVDAANYYALAAGTAAGYANGVCRLYSSGAWVARSPDADLAFQVTGVQETTEQVVNAVSACGPFLTAVDILSPSGVYSSPYRDGDGSAVGEVEALLKSGTSSGRRLLATVTRERRVRVFEEPLPGEHDYWLASDGRLQDVLGQTVRAETCTVGVWARLRDVIPATADLSRLADPSPVFIEAAEYTAATDEYVPEPRGLPSVWELGQAWTG